METATNNKASAPAPAPVFAALTADGQRNAEALHLAAINDGRYYSAQCAAARQELECWDKSPAFRRVISVLVRHGLRNQDESRPTLMEQHAAAELSRAYYHQHVLEAGGMASE